MASQTVFYTAYNSGFPPGSSALDSIYGYFYDNDYNWSGDAGGGIDITRTTGGTEGAWYIEITSVENNGVSDALDGYNVVYNYVDGESGSSGIPYASVNSGYSGFFDNAGSKYSALDGTGDYAYIDGSYSHHQGVNFFSIAAAGSKEADSSAINAKKVYYTALHRDGDGGALDYQRGFFYDDDYALWHTHLDGNYETYTPTATGYWYYYITDVYSGYSNAGDDLVYVYDYTDGESGTLGIPYNYYTYGYSGYGTNTGPGAHLTTMLGASEYAYINGSYDHFGASNYFSAMYEADPASVLVYYTAYNTSGDRYHGYLYDNDGAYSRTGFHSSTYSETGAWSYYVDAIYTDTVNGNAYDGYNYAYHYYDYQSGTASRPYYGYAYDNVSTITSASDYAWTGSYYDLFSSYYEVS